MVMPTLLDVFLDPLSLAVFAIFALLTLWEVLAPARKLPTVPFWHARALLSFLVYFLLSAYLPVLWASALEPLQLFDLSALGVVGGGLVGLLVYQLVAYVWHRSIHASDWLWRAFHQTHHSAERLDTSSAFWYSPLGATGWVAINSLALTVIVGLSAQATTATLLMATLLAIFTHTNVRTPLWLGYIVERPESHALHHGRGHHRDNYSELPIFDMLFGTFRNPESFVEETGFHDGASARMIDMLLMRDVSKPKV
jgi:sterol desaturase/sphingolipid hydroxylase (fatty acid hydroxylase superfamily)